MTQEEFLTTYKANAEEASRLRREANGLEKANDDLRKQFTNEHRKFQDGDMVQYTHEKYNPPRKYFVKEVLSWADSYYGLRISYKIATAKGFEANGGWFIDEDQLVPHPSLNE